MTGTIGIGGMPAFELRGATSVAEATDWLAAPGARVLAGGTDLVPNLRRGLERPGLLVDIGGITSLSAIDWGHGSCMIGAGVTLARLASDARIVKAYPALAQAAAAVGAPAHRAAGTVGGNLCLDTRCVFYDQGAWWRGVVGGCLKRGGDVCHVAPNGARCYAAFSGDLAAALIALGAEVGIASSRGARRIALAALYRDDGAAHLTLASGELVVAVHLPEATGVSAYRKARVRGAFDFPLAGVAIAASFDRRRIERVAVALTGTQPQPFLLAGTEILLGRDADEAAATALGKLVSQQTRPMRTTATPSAYRRQVAVVLAGRLLRELAA